MTEQNDAKPTTEKNDQLDKNSLTKNLADVWNKTTSGITSGITKLMPVNQVAQKLEQWFSVSDSQVAEILATIRAELPTTEALLLGKTQSGKSSLVRGLTGVSAEIVGQGFRPHTQHTQRYFYPANDLPLLIFTDTVGLGDINQNTEEIIKELILDLEQKTKTAKILILTIKINDFATETLRQITEKLRQSFPEIPCLLAVTCLHEVYPPEITDHPDYPPNLTEVQRAFTTIQQDFSKLCDRSVLIDFTLEEDGYNPTFYGLSALRDNLAALLPEAEAQTIHQLLDKQGRDKIGNLYRDTGRRLILPFAIMAATLAAVPLPFATMPVLTALQVSMVGMLGRIYGQTLTASQAGGILSAIAGGFFAQAVARELIKLIPGFGSVIAASWAAAYTFALGEGACVYFGDIMGGNKPDPQKIQTVMQEAFENAKQRFKNIKS
ncbi:MAG TPA: DUF697 domain-containing protein [Nostocaceae cyanobacterium]|nr:DUF697 domain-containing protein [Nostocaceae cyanobacterium]